MTPQYPLDLFRLKKKRIHHTPPLTLQKTTQLGQKEPNRQKAKLTMKDPAIKSIR